MLQQDQGLLGPNHAHLGKVLSALAEIYKDRDNSDKETDEQILQIFKSIPQQVLLQWKDSFSQKQERKIGKIRRMLSGA